MSAKQNRTGSLIVDPRGKPAGPVIMDQAAALAECKRWNETLNGRIPEVVGEYYHLASVEVIG